MEPLSGAANIIAVIQLTGMIVQICGGYIKKVGEARQDVIHLQGEVDALAEVLKSLKALLETPNGRDSVAPKNFIKNLANCSSTLKTLLEKIDPHKTHNPMRKWGLRAFKWPLERDEVVKVVGEIERYKTLFSLSLLVDQRKITDEMSQKIDLSRLRVAKGAAFNDYENQHAECLSGTRTDILRGIDDWSTTPDSKCIFWLNGMAGTGKSTISRTVARHLKERGTLAASFFFKRGEQDRGNARLLFSTLAKQIASTMTQTRPGIRNAIEDDPDISDRALREQFDKLILQPILTINQGPGPTMIILVDALDECDKTEDIETILYLLPQVEKSKSLRLRFLLTSRPILPIRTGFERIQGSYQDCILQEVPKEVIEKDISLYIRDQFTRLRQERSYPPDWPGEASLKALIEKSVPLFISAATLCRFIGDTNWNPHKRLHAILADQAIYASKMESTYMPLLNHLFVGQDEEESQQLIREFKDIIGVVIPLFAPLSANALSALVDIEQDDVENRLRSFHSVLRIPDDPRVPIRLFHLSFRDFLLNPLKKDIKHFWIDERQAHRDLAARCINLMNQRLKKNMCNLNSDGALRDEVHKDSIDRHIPPEFHYACRYWVLHLVQSCELATGIASAIAFLKVHFLHWVEAMSLLGIITEALKMIHLLESVISSHETADILLDMRRFILRNRYIADIAPLQLYSSCIIFALELSVIRALFLEGLPESFKTLPKVEALWGTELQTLEGHSGPVSGVVFSPNNQVLATGSHDNTVKFWDTTTGLLQQTLADHDGWVRTISFSSCGRLLASGTEDSTIKLWDTNSGAVLNTFHAQSGSIWSVQLSPGGKLLASGAMNGTAKAWDTTTGSLKHTFQGHTQPVRAVAFSPDGQVLVTGSNDRTIKLWDVTSGLLQRTLQGHLGWVRAIAFSSCGRLLASGSHDGSVKLWDTSTGALRHTLTIEESLNKTLGGDQDSVGAVVFSPDGRILASGTHGSVIRLWDVTSGTLLRTLHGHSYSVWTVAFSSDGQLLASGSFDSTAKLWDMSTQALQENHIESTARQSIDRHTSTVGVVTFSSSGKILASGSIDRTVKLWDAASGTLRHTLKGHLDLIWALKFSVDDRLLASGSDDCMIKVWDTSTGTLQQTFHGHSGKIRAVAFSPESQVLASWSLDETIKIWSLLDGELIQSIPAKGDMSDIEFANRGTVLETKFGPLSIESWPNGPACFPATSAREALAVEDDWILLHGVRLLWLPPTRRPTCSVVKEGKVALGHTSGSISLMEFHI